MNTPLPEGEGTRKAPFVAGYSIFVTLQVNSLRHVEFFGFQSRLGEYPVQYEADDKR